MLTRLLAIHSRQSTRQERRANNPSTAHQNKALYHQLALYPAAPPIGSPLPIAPHSPSLSLLPLPHPDTLIHSITPRLIPLPHSFEAISLSIQPRRPNAPAISSDRRYIRSSSRQTLCKILLSYSSSHDPIHCLSYLLRTVTLPQSHRLSHHAVESQRMLSL